MGRIIKCDKVYESDKGFSQRFERSPFNSPLLRGMRNKKTDQLLSENGVEWNGKKSPLIRGMSRSDRGIKAY